jgi:hypothetical protein
VGFEENSFIQPEVCLLFLGILKWFPFHKVLINDESHGTILFPLTSRHMEDLSYWLQLSSICSHDLFSPIEHKLKKKKSLQGHKFFFKKSIQGTNSESPWTICLHLIFLPQKTMEMYQDGASTSLDPPMATTLPISLRM